MKVNSGAGAGDPRPKERGVGKRVPPRRVRFGALASLPVGGTCARLWSARLPASDQLLIGALRLRTQGLLARPDFLEVVAVGGAALPAAGRQSGAELEAAQFLRRERRARPGVVLSLREQVPREDGELAGGGDGRDLGPAACADAQEKGAQRAGSLRRDPRRLHEHAARV